MAKTNSKTKKNVYIIITVFVVFIVGIITSLLYFNKKTILEKEKSIIKTIENYKGYTRQVSKEEYDFFYSLTKRDLDENLSAEAIKEEIKSEINLINATFYLGNKLGINEPYSFDNFKKQMEDENASRQVKKDKGETVYGLDKFTLQSFYKYTISNLDLDIASYIAENADKEIIKNAEAYFNEDTTAFKTIAEVKYDINNTKTETLDRDGIKALKNSDGQLFDFITNGEENEEFSYEASGEKREIKILEITYEEADFQNNKSLIVREYISNKLYDNLIKTVAENNPVEFNY